MLVFNHAARNLPTLRSYYLAQPDKAHKVYRERMIASLHGRVGEVIEKLRTHQLVIDEPIRPAQQWKRKGLLLLLQMQSGTVDQVICFDRSGLSWLIYGISRTKVSQLRMSGLQEWYATWVGPTTRTRCDTMHPISSVNVAKRKAA